MNILISGALAGLGACLTKEFLANGHRVFAGVLSTARLQELEEVKDHPSLTILHLDVSDKNSIDTAASQLQEQTGRLDVVLNVAGVLLNREARITQNSYEEILTTFSVNTIGPIHLNNRLLPLLEQAESPTIINISSEVRTINGVSPVFAAYCMSKTAIAQYSFILKQTFEESGIPARVFAVHPGRMKTAMGAENGQISPGESARQIYKIATGEVLPANEEIYVDYLGNPMLQ